MSFRFCWKQIGFICQENIKTPWNDSDEGKLARDVGLNEGAFKIIERFYILFRYQSCRFYFFIFELSTEKKSNLFYLNGSKVQSFVSKKVLSCLSERWKWSYAYSQEYTSSVIIHIWYLLYACVFKSNSMWLECHWTPYPLRANIELYSGENAQNVTLVKTRTQKKSF